MSRAECRTYTYSRELRGWLKGAQCRATLSLGLGGRLMDTGTYASCVVGRQPVSVLPPACVDHLHLHLHLAPSAGGRERRGKVEVPGHSGGSLQEAYYGMVIARGAAINMP